jgi:hypothetical protein
LTNQTSDGSDRTWVDGANFGDNVTVGAHRDFFLAHPPRRPIGETSAPAPSYSDQSGH